MLKVAVIGCGNMGQHHAKAYTKLEQVQFVAACDSNIERFNAINKRRRHQILCDA